MRKILLAIMIIALCAVMTSCDLFSKTPRSDEFKVAKPDFNLAMENYENAPVKKSSLEGKIVLTFHGKNTDVTKRTAGQALILNRIENNGKIYMDGSLNSCDLNDTINALIKAAKISIDTLGDKRTANILKDALNYLDGTTRLQFSSGYDGSSSYNFKGSVRTGSKNNEIYYATDDEFISYELLKNKINAEIKISDYMMFSTFVDFSSSANWINEDTASKFFNAANNICNYEMSARSEKLYNYILGLSQKYIAGLDPEKYASEIRKYNECLVYMKNWLKIGDSTVSATVNSDNLPVTMNTSIRISLDIPLNELQTVINIICNEEDAKKITTVVDKIKTAGFRGLNGEEERIGISFDVSLSEKFYYDEESVSLSNIDADLFINAKETKPGRISYIINENIDSSTEAKTNE